MTSPRGTLRVETHKDGSRDYYHPVTGDRLTSVTTVLGGTEGKQRYLTPWSARVTAETAVDNLDLIVETLANEGRQAAVDLLKDEAELVRGIKADAGSYVHKVAEALILWAASPEGTGSDIAIPTVPDHLARAAYDDEPIDDVIDWMVRGFVNFVAAFDPEFQAAEMTVFNRALGVAGTLDGIIALKGVRLTADGMLVPAPGNRLVLCVDIKTGKRLDVTVQEQLASYRRMTEALMPLGQIVPMPETDTAAVLHLRPEFPTGYRLIPISRADDAKAWNRFRRAVEIYSARRELPKKPGRVAYPLRQDGTMQAPLLADLDGEGYGRVLGPLSNAGLVGLDDVADLTAAELLDIKGIGPKAVETVRRMLADHDVSLADEQPAPIGEVA